MTKKATLDTSRTSGNRGGVAGTDSLKMCRTSSTRRTSSAVPNVPSSRVRTTMSRATANPAATTTSAPLGRARSFAGRTGKKLYGSNRFGWSTWASTLASIVPIRLVH
jgi:hypothetical protein